MDLLTLVVVLAIIGVVVTLLLQLPMLQPFRTAIIVVTILFVAVWLIRLLNLPSISIGR
jgi:hypothetical protein